jgi:amino acid transporter
VLIGVFILSYPLGAQLLNFGALIAFMGVNVSAFVHYYLKAEKKRFTYLIVPLLGFTVCLYLWFSLGIKAKIVGISWLTLGLIYGAYRTNFFKKPLQFAKLESTEEPEETK